MGTISPLAAAGAFVSGFATALTVVVTDGSGTLFYGSLFVMAAVFLALQAWSDRHRRHGSR